MATATYEPIATTTLTSSASGITFSSIPSTYTDLRLVAMVPSASVDNRAFAMRFNSDGGTNYSLTAIRGNGSAASSTRYTNFSYLMFSTYAGISDTIPTLWTADIFNYAGSTYKTVLTSATADKNGYGHIERHASLWRSTSAINTIRVSSYVEGASDFNAGTTVTLYGIKAA